MAIFWTAKTPAGVYDFTWQPAVMEGDSLTSASVSIDAGDAAIDLQERNGDILTVRVSGGTAGTTTEFSATADTGNGETLTETIYLPVIDSDATIADTARDYCNFALRKIAGIGESATASELDVALEHLNALVAEWREGGASIGATLPLTANTVIYCPDYAVSALRYNLKLLVLPEFEAEPSVTDVLNARRGLALVRQRNLPDEREGVDFF